VGEQLACIESSSTVAGAHREARATVSCVLRARGAAALQQPHCGQLLALQGVARCDNLPNTPSWSGISVSWPRSALLNSPTGARHPAPDARAGAFLASVAKRRTKDTLAALRIRERAIAAYTHSTGRPLEHVRSPDVDGRARYAPLACAEPRAPSTAPLPSSLARRPPQ
jgi:hypothetical protein